MENLFRENSKCIKIYIGKEISQDPYEKNVETTLLNPISIKGIVSDLIASQVGWKMPGIVTTKAKEIIVEKKYKSLIEQSQKIIISGDSSEYEGWRVSNKIQIREEGEYLRFYIYSKTA